MADAAPRVALASPEQLVGALRPARLDGDRDSKER
jgi:hypothetical protein